MPHDPRTPRPVPSSNPQPAVRPAPAPVLPRSPSAAVSGEQLELAGFGALCGADGRAAIGVVERVAIDVTVDGAAVGSRWTVRFRNVSTVQLEAFYLCPLPVGSAVVAATARFGDRTVRAELVERDTARQVFDAAVAAGLRTALVEADRAEVFTFTLGRLAPGEHPEITVELAASLDVDLGVAALRLPLVVAPRYSPTAAPLAGEGAHGTVLDPDASRLQAPRTADAALMIPVEVTLRWSGLRDAPQCSEIGAQWSRCDDGWAMAWSGGADRDVVVRAPAAALERAVCFADGLGTHVVRVDLVGPPSAVGGATPGRDVVLLLDRSGSMSGWKMIAAQRLAARLVDALGADDRVLVIGFDDRLECSDAGLLPADAVQRRRIGRFIEGLDGRGGTELAAAISEGCRRLHHGPRSSTPSGDGVAPADRDRVLVLVTDAQVSDEAHSTNTLVAELGDAQVYVIGIDQAVNAGLCRNLASAGGGRFELVTDPTELGGATDRIVARVGRPSVRDVAVRWSDGADELRPAVDLFEGAITSLWMPVRSDRQGRTVRVAGRSASRPWSRELTIERAGDPAVQAAVWAGHELAALERDHEQGSVDAAARAISLSLATGVLCRFTAFIAVDHAGARLAGPTASVVQPLAEPAGWLLQSAGHAASALPLPSPSGPPPALRKRGFASAAPAPAAAPVAPAPWTPASTAAARSAGRSAPESGAAPAGEPSIGAGLLRRIGAVLDQVEADPFGGGLLALAELLDDVATLELPEAARPLIDLLEQLQRTLRDHATPTTTLTAVRAWLTPTP